MGEGARRDHEREERPESDAAEKAIGHECNPDRNEKSSAGAVGADRSDNAASIASLAAFVKPLRPGALHAVALDQRPGIDTALGAVEALVSSPHSYGRRRHLRLTTTVYDMSTMGKEYDPQLQAKAAMREAVNATGLERLRWIRVAQAWLELARIRQEGDGIAGRSC